MTGSVSTGQQGGVATVRVTGEFDLAATEVVGQAIDQAIATGLTGVIVDLSGTQFLDSSGISTLLKGRRKADQAGIAYRVSGATDMVRQILILTGVLEYLSADPTIECPE